ncbi:MAG: hypothetical protein J2O48_06695 [Solirubrobacterales bacterium]|nr:hypothetical protein [Solirubrobacterales bacterium]
MRRGLSILVTGLALLTPATAQAAGSSSGGFGGSDWLWLALAAVIVLAAIALFVWYDARRTAGKLKAGGAGTRGPGEGAHSGSKAPQKPRKLSAQEKKRRKRGRAPRRK